MTPTTAALEEQAYNLMLEFYTSKDFDHSPIRHADTVLAAIKYTLLAGQARAVEADAEVFATAFALSLACGDLIIATDKQDQFQLERQHALDAMKAYASAIREHRSSAHD